ncbi:hypothetical protein SSP24_00540 [Streptomyces spinoverrucosus]|uniref:Uncharacterized protein n=1 Tax=Streptomyces spinoverrucosus TaxID=284043 RepID=A0A4Y3V9S7_9ACTN|nr:hypothetical protein [Streptomyces spinoverrucosus]GEC02399.1 hypothetical protein SSP24_00540 [Streptomyces spinoverrucosus]GHB43218.1 hypothetical protein GCM10010397_12050 [Streptomyces spinoverrucosus]
MAVDLPGFGRTPGPPGPLDVHGLSLALADWLRATGRGPAPLVADSTPARRTRERRARQP